MQRVTGSRHPNPESAMEIEIPQTTPGPNGHGAPAPAPAPTGAQPASALPHPNDLGQRPNVENTQNAMRGVRTAQAMGWFSIGLGLTQLIAPRALEGAIGVKRGDGLVMRLLGARQLINGLGLLTQRRTAYWTGARLAGDLMDLALLGREFAGDDNDRGRLAGATVAVLAATAMDVHATRQLAGDVSRQEQVAQVTNVGAAITIDASREALYAYWRRLENMPTIMDHVREVEVIDDVRARWTGSGPRDTTIRWDTEIVEDRPGELIAWRTVGGPFESSGSVRFLVAPGGRGTEVVVDMHYQLRGGIVGKAVAFLSGREPGIEAARGLRVLKQIFELGEVMKSDASIHRGMHPGRPPSAKERVEVDRGDRATTAKGAV